MASYTTNLNLKKPAGSENVAIGDINGNMDTIDTAYGALNSHIAKYGCKDNITGFSSFSGEYYADVTISHGVGATPTAFIVTPYQNGATPSNYITNVSVVTLNENGAIVRVWAKADLSGLVSLYWAAFP